MHSSLDCVHKFAQLAVRCFTAFLFFVVVVSVFYMLCFLVVFVTVMLIVELKCCFLG